MPRQPRAPGGRRPFPVRRALGDQRVELALVGARALALEDLAGFPSRDLGERVARRRDGAAVELADGEADVHPQFPEAPPGVGEAGRRLGPAALEGGHAGRQRISLDRSRGAAWTGGVDPVEGNPRAPRIAQPDRGAHLDDPRIGCVQVALDSAALASRTPRPPAAA